MNQIIKLNEEQEADFMELTQKLHKEMINQNMYCPFEEDFINELNPDNHFSVGAYDNEMLMGGFTVYFPTEVDCYSNYLDMDIPLAATAHMDNCAIADNYRGRKLQVELCKYCEQILCDQYPNRVHLLCTVHPQNYASMKNMLSCGYKVIKEVDHIYGDQIRCILYKKLS